MLFLFFHSPAGNVPNDVLNTNFRPSIFSSIPNFFINLWKIVHIRWSVSPDIRPLTTSGNPGQSAARRRWQIILLPSSPSMGELIWTNLVRRHQGDEIDPYGRQQRASPHCRNTNNADKSWWKLSRDSTFTFAINYEPRISFRFRWSFTFTINHEARHPFHSRSTFTFTINHGI